MARRDDGNEPVPAPQVPGQVDLVAPDGATTDPGGNLVVQNPAPPGYGNQLDFSAFQEICRFGIQPRDLNKIFLRFLQGHFARAENIYIPEVRPYLWSPDKGKSRLQINQNTATDAATGSRVPMLLVKRGTQQSNSQVIGDRVGSSMDEMTKGKIRYVRFNSGSSTVISVGETDLHTELLAQEVYQALTWMGPEITRRLPFHNFQVTSLGETGILDLEGNRFGIPVTINYIYEYGWWNDEQAPTLNGLSITLQAGT